MAQISGLSQKCPDFNQIMSGILDPRIPTFWNSAQMCIVHLTRGAAVQPPTDCVQQCSSKQGAVMTLRHQSQGCTVLQWIRKVLGGQKVQQKLSS